jgi:hypothetical protein
MARGYPVRLHPQNLQERLMPHTQFEALEKHQQARRKRGIDSNESIIEGNNDNNAEDAGDPQGEPALAETRIRETTVDMIKRVLLFSQVATEALYDDQMITALDTLQDLTDDIINLTRCKTITQKINCSYNSYTCILRNN